VGGPVWWGWECVFCCVLLWQQVHVIYWLGVFEGGGGGGEAVFVVGWGVAVVGGIFGFVWLLGGLVLGSGWGGGGGGGGEGDF